MAERSKDNLLNHWMQSHALYKLFKTSLHAHSFCDMIQRMTNKEAAMQINIDDELAKLDAEVKKLTLIKEKRNAIAALTNELFPATVSSMPIVAATAAPKVMRQPDLLKAPHKKDQIIEFAKSFLGLIGDATTRQLVAAMEDSDQGDLLAERQNKVVAVSQALGKRKDLFGTDRTRGWFLIATEKKG
jgi:hypothetical protein